MGGAITPSVTGCSTAAPADTRAQKGQVLAVADVYLAVVVDKLVHATRAERSADNVGDGGTRIDVRNELRFALRGVCTLLQQNNRWLHSHAAAPSHHLGDTLITVRALRVCVRAAMHTDAIAVPTSLRYDLALPFSNARRNERGKQRTKFTFSQL